MWQLRMKTFLSLRGQSGTGQVSDKGGGKLALRMAKINLNTATSEELPKPFLGLELNVLGISLPYRESHGGFQSVDDLKNVSGIGDKNFR